MIRTHLRRALLFTTLASASACGGGYSESNTATVLTNTGIGGTGETTTTTTGGTTTGGASTTTTGGTTTVTTGGTTTGGTTTTTTTGGTTPPVNTLCPDEKDTWNNYASDWFGTNCSGCHGFASVYAGVVNVKVDIINRIDSKNMPRGATIPSADIKRIDTWFNCGLPE